LGSEDDEADAVPCAKKSKDEVINKTWFDWNMKGARTK
jgi:hypothetical protein